jgi:hypothetical protein
MNRSTCSGRTPRSHAARVLIPVAADHADGPKGVTRLEVVDPDAGDVEAVLGVWELAR